MMIKKKFVLGSSCAQLLFSMVFAQEQDYILMGKKYRHFGGKWYVLYQGHIADEILRHRIIVRLKDRGEMESFDFASYSISGVSLASRRILDGFYLLVVDVGIDPFEIADTLEKTSVFDFIEFDALGQQADTPDDPNFPLQWNLMPDKRFRCTIAT